MRNVAQRNDDPLLLVVMRAQGREESYEFVLFLVIDNNAASRLDAWLQLTKRERGIMENVFYIRRFCSGMANLVASSGD